MGISEKTVIAGGEKQTDFVYIGIEKRCHLGRNKKTDVFWGELIQQLL